MDKRPSTKKFNYNEIAAIPHENSVGNLPHQTVSNYSILDFLFVEPRTVSVLTVIFV